MVSAAYHYRCESCGKTSATRPGIEDSTPHSTVPHREGPVGVRIVGVPRVGSLYMFKQHGGLFLDYPVYMRPIGGWC